MARNLEITPNIIIPSKEIEFNFSRASGAGGQNVNKVNSKATLRWNVLQSLSIPDHIKQRFLARFAGYITKEGDYLISSTVHRDQIKNIEDCYEKLHKALSSVLKREKKRIKTKPSRGHKEKRINSKKINSSKKASRQRPSNQ